MRLPRVTLSRKADYDKVFREGRRYKQGALVLLAARVDNESSWKLGMMVSRKKGKAVRRNRFRRCVREWFRQHSEKIPAGYWYIVIPVGSVEADPKPTLYETLAALIARIDSAPEGGRA